MVEAYTSIYSIFTQKNEKCPDECNTNCKQLVISRESLSSMELSS
jgi:hypothetical protein